MLNFYYSTGFSVDPVFALTPDSHKIGIWNLKIWNFTFKIGIWNLKSLEFQSNSSDISKKKDYRDDSLFF